MFHSTATIGMLYLAAVSISKPPMPMPPSPISGDHRTARPGQPGADRHPDAVADGRQRAGVDELAGKSGREPVAHVAREGEAVDDHHGRRVEHR